MRAILTITFACLLAAACSEPRSAWPGLDFGPEIAAIDAAGENAEPALGPLPSLSQAQQAGIEDPPAYLDRLSSDFADLKAGLKERQAAAAEAIAGVALSDLARREDAWLGAEMALSNLSQEIEQLPAIRARAALVEERLADPAPAQALGAEAADIELSFRAFLSQEKRRLAGLAGA